MTDDKLRPLYDAILATSSLHIPAGRRELMFGAFCEVKRWSAIVKDYPVDPTSEPSHAFSLAPSTTEHSS
ncbi:MAG: hypothetical protein AAF493_10165 [Pseudomonadota bacterium]